MQNIREMRHEDLDAALGMINEEGWGYTTQELERMLRLEPRGSFVSIDGAPVGVVTTVVHGPIGVIGHLVVSRKARGGGIGRSLLTRALEHLRARGCDSTIVIATDEGVPVYSKFGFRITQEIHCKHLLVDAATTSVAHPNALPMERTDLGEICELDADLFGADRRDLIRSLYEESPGSCFKLQGDEGITGICMGRDTSTGYDLGPWICRPSSFGHAEELLFATLASARPGRVFTGIFAENEPAVSISQRLPVFRYWSTKLMVLGKDRAYTDIDQIFGIAAFELG